MSFLFFDLQIDDDMMKNKQREMAMVVKLARAGQREKEN